MAQLPKPESIAKLAQKGAGGDAAAQGPLGGGISKGTEFVGVLLVFMGLGWLLDSAFGTSPWIMVALIVVGLVGQFARMWYAYDADMKRHEADRAAASKAAPK